MLMMPITSQSAAASEGQRKKTRREFLLWIGILKNCGGGGSRTLADGRQSPSDTRGEILRPFTSSFHNGSDLNPGYRSFCLSAPHLALSPYPRWQKRLASALDRSA
jgi:hypothetical protein